MSGWQPSVSVIVPAFNAASTIDDCVRSLLELRYPTERLELRVVDNRSTDSTAEALRAYGGRIAVTDERRRSPAAARNAGMRDGMSEVVAFTDADCVVEPDWLAHLVHKLEDPTVGVAGGAVRALPGSNAIEQFGERIHDHQAAIEVYVPPYAITGSWACRRAVISAFGGFDERLAPVEDVDLSYRLIQAGYRLAFVPEAVVYHRNEKTLAGLFKEGFQHGFHGVRAIKRHRAFLAALGHKRINRDAYAELTDGLRRWARRESDIETRCQVAFEAGKKAGKALGSIRFGHLDL